MSERSRLPNLLRWRVVGRMEMGLSQAVAARRLNMSRSVVHTVSGINIKPKHLSVSRKYVTGRPRATTLAGDRFITLPARRRRKISVPQLVADHLSGEEYSLVQCEGIFTS
ncbi:HTH_Tnp_Tc3_2 domain-containing protein [Trichonephila clavipes]|nr:HTH_Tnp_Tc3_2 domain-containing protein [Trichonephila clavipes]